jgi:hypothetical protein
MIRRWHRLGAIDEHPKHPVLASAHELNLYDFEPAGGRYPLGNCPNSINLKHHFFNKLDWGRKTDFRGN